MADMVIVPSGCKKSPKPHSPHYWVEGWIWPKTIDCPGIPEKTEKSSEALFPCSEECCEECKDVGELPHKHYLKFNGYAWTSRPGEPYREVPQRLKDLMFQCCDPFCLYEIRMTRQVFEDALLKRKDVNQTWPS